MQELQMELAQNPNEAPNYGNDWVALKLEKVVFVRKGTESGRATLDLQLVDENGKKYVAMISKALIAPIVGLYD